MTGMGSTKSILSTDSYKAEHYEGNKNYQHANFKNYYNETTVTNPGQFGSSKSLVSTDSYKAECYEQNLYSPPLPPFTYIPPAIQSESSKSFIKLDTQKHAPFVFDKPHIVQQSSVSSKNILLTDSSGNCAMGPTGSSKNVQFTFQNNVPVVSDNLPVQSSISTKSLHSASQPFNIDYYETNNNNSINHFIPLPAPLPLPQLPSQSIPTIPVKPPNSLYRIEYYDKKAAIYQNNLNVLRTSNILPVITSNDMNNTIQSALIQSQTVNHGIQQINNEYINNSESNLVTEHDVDFFAHFENQLNNESEKVNANVNNTENKAADYSNSNSNSNSTQEQEQDGSLSYFSEDYEEILGYLNSESSDTYDTT